MPLKDGTGTAQTVLVLDAQIPSHILSVSFTVRIDGTWRPTQTEVPAHPHPQALARLHLRTRTEAVLRRLSVLHPGAAQDATNLALASWAPAAAGLETCAAVQVTASPDDCRLAQEHLRRQRVIDLDHADEQSRQSGTCAGTGRGASSTSRHPLMRSNVAQLVPIEEPRDHHQPAPAALPGHVHVIT
ncbi:hypothetical protein AB0D27_28520 [Streptomyces sp. NPDC048415]|uniref:hypothetical protein n=1 Tax=Streptomyces sp. NPDC048415 TaxID=3154822 RepID=UPI00342F1C6E